MPHVYLSKEAYDRIIQLGHSDVGRFLVHAVELAVEEEVRQIPKSDPLPLPGSLSFTSIPTAAPTVTSDTTTKSQKKRKVTKPKPPTFTMKGTFLKKLQCDRCLEQFPNRDDFDLHLPCSE